MKDTYPTVVTYAKENLKTFSEEPFSEVDSLLFSELSYIYIHEEDASTNSEEGMPIKDLLKAEWFSEMFSRIWYPEDVKELLFAVAASPRYRDVRLRYYRNVVDQEKNLQFSGVVFSLSETLHYVAYRGTDWSIVGWKEDFLLALPDPVAAQKLSVEYLEEMGEKLEGTFLVGGHSKGGNLAVYAASCSREEIQARIEAVYSHDGPGFERPFLESEGFLRIQKRIQKSVPHFSFFGQIFQQETEAKMVESNGIAILQHFPLTWKVEGNHFAECTSLSSVSSAAVLNLNQWLSTLDTEERSIFIDTVFKLIDELGVTTIDDFSRNVPENLAKVLKTVNGLEPKTRRFMHSALRFALFGIRSGGIAIENSPWDDVELEEMSSEYPDA